MISFIRPWLLGLTFEANPLDGLLRGLVCACGISALCSLVRVHLFLKAASNSDGGNGKNQSGTKLRAKSGLSGMLKFWFLTGLLGLVGPHVASLVVLEFCLRAVTAKIIVGPDMLSRYIQQYLVQCQFSLGCALSCSLHFLQEGAMHHSFSLLLAAGPSWLLASQSERLWHHVAALYPLHSSQRYCGVCITLLESGHALLPRLCQAVVLAFAVAAVAAISIVNHHFLLATEALQFWTPLVIFYTLLVVYMQEEQHRRPGGEAIFHTVAVRLGGLLVVMARVGTWVDVADILLCLLGEAACLVPSQDLLSCMPEEEGDEDLNKPPQRWRRDLRPGTHPESATPHSRDKEF